MLSSQEIQRFIELFSQFTKIPKSDLKSFIKEDTDIINLLKRPQMFSVDATKIQKISDINELRQLIKVGFEANYTQISSPAGVYSHLIQYADKTDKEHFIALFLDNKNKILKTDLINIGTQDSSLVSVKDIAKRAILYDCSSVIISHNHPSGIPSPSNEDLLITSRINSTLELVGVRLLDHIILGHNTFASLKELGHMDGFKSLRELLSEESVPYTTNQGIQGLKSYSFTEIEKIVTDFAKERLLEADITDVEIIGMKSYGSRTTGLSKNNSDLDIVLEFKGAIREDDLFQILNNEPFEINGITIDINPITQGKSGTIEQFFNVDRSLYNIKSHIINLYSNEFPAIKHISEDTAKIINDLNKQRDIPLTVKEIRQAHETVGKRLELGNDKSDLQEFKLLQSVVDDFKKSQLTEKQFQAQEQVKEEVQVVKINMIER